jgi:1,4-dihydroxy-6-naphthoate synthase
MASPIRLAFSPDSDDLFMFWPLLTGKVDTEGLTFVSDRADTEALNERVARGDVDVSAVSIARYAAIADDWLLLPHGMSVGRNYGPVVVSHGARTLASLEGKRIGTPGLKTTAHLVLSLVAPRFEPVVVPIAPFSRAFEAVRSGEVDATTLIHEGRLTYQDEGFALVADLGVEWAKLTGGLPLPLGGNVIAKRLGPDLIAQVSRLCRTSIAWAIAHRDEVIDGLAAGDERKLGFDRAMVDKYLGLYANADTADAPEDVRVAVRELFARAHAAGLHPSLVNVEYAP